MIQNYRILNPKFKYQSSKNTSSQEVKALLKKYNLRALKQLGQHFLIDKKVLIKIVGAAKLTKRDSVLEIGSGLGILTEALAEKAGKVIAIEIDKGLVKYLEWIFRIKRNEDIVHENILKLRTKDLASRLGSKNKFNYKVVANLPYYITSRVIRYFLEAETKPNLIVFLVQKEVAERIVAKPPKMSLLSCSVQFYGKPEIVDFVPQDSFWPKPEIESAILRIKVYKKPKVKVANQKLFFQVIKAGFSNKRKQLHNALAGGLHLSNEQAKDLLKKSSIDSARRAQTLNLEEWAEVTKHVT